MYNTITIADFAFYCTEPALCKIKIYDNETDEFVFDGTLDMVPHKYKDMTLQSYDVLSFDDDFDLCLNIDSSCTDVYR